MQAEPSKDKDSSFARLSDLNFHVAVKIVSSEGRIPKTPYSDLSENENLRHTGVQQDGLADLYVTCQSWTDGKAETSPFRTSWKDFSRTYLWNQTVVLPITYTSLLPTSQSAFTIWDVQGPGKPVPVGGTTMSSFRPDGTLRRGQQRSFAHRNKEADPRPDTTTPSEVPTAKDEMGRSEQSVKDYERGDIAKIDWSDRIAFRQIERAHATEASKSDNSYLYVDSPRFDFTVVFSEQASAIPYPPAPVSHPLPPHQQATSVPSNTLTNDRNSWTSYDPDSWRENPVEIKHRKLLRSQRSGDEGRDLKPGPSDRDRSNEIFHSPPTASLSANDKDSSWKFRFSLFRSPRSSTKFLKCVTWSDAEEAKQATEKSLPLWGQDVGIDDALELLGPGFSDCRVRAFAVERSKRADDEEILLYSSQSVQALKFEHEPTSTTRSHRRRDQPAEERGGSGLAQFLIDRAVANPISGTTFHWYSSIECNTQTAVGKLYAKVAFNFHRKSEETPEGSAQRAESQHQNELVEALTTRAKDVRASKDARSHRIDKSRSYIADSKHNLSPSPQAVTSPSNPRISVSNIIPDKASVFKSNSFPLSSYFQKCKEEGEEEGSDAEPAGEYPIIFKDGDDSRQDQLVIQSFTSMDRSSRKENLDLRISPYSVLATSSAAGMIQFVPSKSSAAIMAEYGSLQAYSRENHADDGASGSYGIEAGVMDNFIRSCAGYSVSTYVSGVGDRHSDNLMLAPDGHFFHVDFGYILGRDPKPYPPPVKVCKEMVDAMGGTASAHYARFQSLCYTAFIGSRKNSNSILNLVALMVDAGIQDIQLEPDKAVWKVQEKFMLDSSEEDAIKQFEVLLNETSYSTAMFDRIHDWAQYSRD